MNPTFDSISIKIASPDQIKDESKRTSCKRRNPAQAAGEPFLCPERGTCSCGEVKKAETINYRSFRPEPEGLFCEAIFGPQKDWECNCGKYKRIKHKGVICDRCGVEITQQRVRRDRLGYIQLAAPVSHIWYFKGLPSRIGSFCELSTRDLERVLYFEGFLVVEVTDPECPLERGQVLTEVEYVENSTKYWDGFRADTGAEVIRELLSDIDLKTKKEQLTTELEETTSRQKKLKIAKQLKQFADFDAVGQRPEWMILDVIPVIPPDIRPLVPLEGGRFATSDLNDLYRRVINRNNRLRKLIQLRSPEVILRNEKRMLQEAVDAFFDNGKQGRVVNGPGNRPLKSIAHVLKGKTGRFRQNLLGKRVDYSGRSVIVVGPELELHQCGLPKRMAVELFKPFIIERLQAYGHTQTIKAAKNMVDHLAPDSPVWDVVEEVIADHPVLLNRPPTLHRLGIQAFLPVLVEGKSIRIPPLVCKAFNADFDGDQMAVHVPLTAEAQAEAKLLMVSSHNILKPSHGDPVAVPELDMVLGPSFLTKTLPEHAADAELLHEAYTTNTPAAFEALREKPWFHRRYAHPEEVITAHAAGQLNLHDSIQLFCAPPREDGQPREPILTTVGRVIFNEVLPPDLTWDDENSGQQTPFFNAEAGGRALSALIQLCFSELGTRTTTEVLGNVQKLAFEYATLSGISPGIMDYMTPDERDDSVSDARSEIDTLLSSPTVAEMTDEELENEQIRIWQEAIKAVENTMFSRLPELETSLVERCDPRKIHPYVAPDGSEIHDGTVEGFSPVHIMADSGARARKNPFMQISAVIGLKAKQSGEILIPPITSSYREGLDVLDYFNSTYGSRKGLVDTAMKTAASGYLTRKLVDVAQDVRITAEDCRTLNSVQKFATAGGDLAFKIRGRTAAEDILHPENGKVLVPEGTLISEQVADQIDRLGITVVKVRSVLTCQTDYGVCATCYGHDLTTNELVNVGEAVGIIAAQSIGEPGTQLTMRTFHTGGAAEDVFEVEPDRILSKVPGTVYFRDFQPGRTVEEQGERWVVIEDKGNLEEPAYEVQQVNHPNCPLRAGELLSEKQQKEYTERYKGFETKPWQYLVTEVLYKVVSVDDPELKLEIGTELSEEQYHTYKQKGPFELARYYEVITETEVLTVGECLTESEYEAYLKEDSSLSEKVKACYEVVSVDDPELKLEIGTELSEEQYHTYKQKGPFELARVEEGDRLSEAEYRKAQQDYGFQRFVTPKYRVTKVEHPTLSLTAGDLITEEEVETLKAEIRQGFDGEWRSRDSETGELWTDEQSPSTTKEVNEKNFKRTYLITECTRPDFPFKEGEEVSPEDIAPWLTPFEVDGKKPVYVVQTPVAGFAVGQALTVSEYDAARSAYQPFEVEKQDVELHTVTAVYHPECPLNIGEDLSEEALTRFHKKWTGFDAEKLRYRVTKVHHPDCPLKPDALIGENQKKQCQKQAPGFVTSRSESTAGGFEGDRLYQVTSVNHSDCPLEVGELLTQKESTAKRRNYKGFEVARHYEVISIEDGTEALSVGQRLTEIEYKAYRKTDPSLSEKVKSIYQVVGVHHPKLKEPFEVARSYEVIQQRLTESAYEALLKADPSLSEKVKPIYEVVSVHHPELPLEVGTVLSEEDYQTYKQKEPFEVTPHYEVIRIEDGVDRQGGRAVKTATIDRQDHESVRGRFIQGDEQDDVTTQGTETLSVGQRLTEIAYEALLKADPALLDKVKPLYEVVSVHHSELTLEVGTELDEEAYQTYKQKEPFEVARSYEVIQQRLTESAYEALMKTDPSLSEKVKACYEVVSIHDPEVTSKVATELGVTLAVGTDLSEEQYHTYKQKFEGVLAVGTELSEKEYRTYNRNFKGFDTALVYRITKDKREVDERLAVGTVLSSKEFREHEKANRRVTHTITEVYHPNCPSAVGDELSEEEYRAAAERYPGFEVDELEPRLRIEVETADGNRVPHVIRAGYSLSVTEGDSVQKEAPLAESHGRTENRDIVAGIPRVTDLFEARPKSGEAAEIAEIEGYVRFEGMKRGFPAYSIEHEGFRSGPYLIPDEKRRVAEGDWVDAGQPLTDGLLNPHQILKIGRTTIEGVPVEGEEAVWSYLVDEVQKVYGKGVINDKHIETIVRQMLTKIRITGRGDTNFYPNNEVQRRQFERVNREIVEKGGTPATGVPILQGISKASLSTESFISAASFQQTTKVLTDAATSGQTDRLSGLKENVILGRLIPAGTGFHRFQNLEVSALETEIDEAGEDD